MTVEDALVVIEHALGECSKGDIETKIIGNTVIGGVAVDQFEFENSVDSAQKTFWVHGVYTEGKDFITYSIVLKYSNESNGDWWEAKRVQAKKTVKIDDNTVFEESARVVKDFANQIHAECDKVRKRQDGKKDRLAHDKNANPDYNPNASSLVIDIVRASSGEVKHAGPTDMETLANVASRNRDSSGTTRVTYVNGKKVLQWVNPKTHRWEDVPVDNGGNYAHWKDPVLTVELVRGQYRSLTKEEQRAEGKTDFRWLRLLISEHTAKKMFRRLFEFDEVSDIMMLLHGSNQKVELFVGNDRYFEPVGTWIGKNRKYFKDLKRSLSNKT